MNKITNITPEVNEALICHQQIVQSGKVAASALVDMGKGLKKMRDEKLYEQLGYESFGEYVEKNGDYSFKERQAYTYIKAVETFSDKFLTENGDLGITKLGMLTVLGEREAAEVIECHELSGLTSEEVKALVKEKQALGEQLSFWKDETQKAKDGKDDLLAKIEKLTKDLEQAEAAAEKNEEMKRKVALDAQKADEKLKKEKNKHKEDVDKLRAEIEMIKAEQAASAEPTEEQKKAIAAEYEKQIEELKQAAQAAEEEKKKLEDKLKNGSVDEMRAAMKVYFAETQKAIKNFCEKLSEITDEETKKIYTSGTVKWLQSIIDEFVPY